MDKRKILRQEEALELVSKYKRVIVPQLHDDLLKLSTRLWMIASKVNYLIEPVLMEENEPLPLYRDVMPTGIAV